MANEPDCVCGHAFMAHITMHRGGCLGMPERGCGPDCFDPCGVDTCPCGQYEPKWADGEDGAPIGEDDPFGESHAHLGAGNRGGKP